MEITSGLAAFVVDRSVHSLLFLFFPSADNSRYYSIPLVVGRRIAQIVFFDRYQRPCFLCVRCD